jgi:hypothetical protein
VDCGDCGNTSLGRLCDNTYQMVSVVDVVMLKHVGYSRCGKSQVDCIIGVVTLYQVVCAICMEMLHQRCSVFSKQTLFLQI